MEVFLLCVYIHFLFIMTFLNLYDIFIYGDIVIKKVIKIILVLLCMIMIFSFSSDEGDISSKKSDSMVIYISEMVTRRNISSDKREEYIKMYSFYIRKLAHFSIYFVLGLLIISLLSEYMDINYKSIMIALLISFIYACSDEIHQLFVSGRSCKVFDVLIDSVGSFVGINLYYFIYKAIRRKKCEQKKAIC